MLQQLSRTLKLICSRTYFHNRVPNGPIRVKECTPLPVPCGLSWWSEPNPLHLYCPLTPLLIHLPPPPRLLLHLATAGNCSITAVLTPVCETRSETFKSKVTAASEAFNLHLKERAPPLTPTPPRPHPFLHPCPRPLHSHILDHPVPPRHLRSVCCVFASVHSLSWMNVCFDLGAHDTPAGQSASSIKGTICRLFM